VNCFQEFVNFFDKIVNEYSLIGKTMSRQEQIVNMFDSIAKNYDLVNRVLTFGIDKKWRREAVKTVYKFINKKNLKLLDVACGTGDMIEYFKKEAKKEQINLTICGLDPSIGMLAKAKKRFPNIKFYKAYATDIPCKNNSLDGVSISFGIRNVVEIQKAIDEFYRVLKKDGIVAVLEFTRAKKDNKLRKCVDFYSSKILPKIGGFLSKNKNAYEYLPKSIENFYTSDELAKLFINSGFKIEKITNFNLGQVTLLIARKI